MGRDDGGRLDLDAFVAEAETTPERVAHLIEIGAIRPVGGTFSNGDVTRVRLLAAFEAGGIDLEHIAAGLRERSLTLEYVDRFYPGPSPRTGRTYEAFAVELGDLGARVAPSIAAMGLPAPRAGDVTRSGDEAVIRAFLEAWAVTDASVTTRAARTFGDAVRRAAEAWVALFDEAIAKPLQARSDQSPGIDELAEHVVAPAIRINDAAHALIVWLLDRHLERTMTALDIESLERELGRRGLVEPEPDHPPAVAFVDLTDYTGLTETKGDETAVRAVVRLGELAESAARDHGGRVVKLLGDGVLMVFDEPAGAVRASVEIRSAMHRAGLPSTHAGVHAGSVINRDGDVYGSTVNIAARVATRAPAGEILVTDAVRDRLDPHVDVVEAFGEVELKGVHRPVALYRIVTVPG
jgi:adenylate cyclase